MRLPWNYRPTYCISKYNSYLCTVLGSVCAAMRRNRLKGNQVKILNRPATVNPKKISVEHSH